MASFKDGIKNFLLTNNYNILKYRKLLSNCVIESITTGDSYRDWVRTGKKLIKRYRDDVPPAVEVYYDGYAIFDKGSHFLTSGQMRDIEELLLEYYILVEDTDPDSYWLGKQLWKRKRLCPRLSGKAEGNFADFLEVQ